jgi:hypothetical protein
MAFGLPSGHQGTQPIISGLEQSGQMACQVGCVGLDVLPNRCRLSQQAVPVHLAGGGHGERSVAASERGRVYLDPSLGRFPGDGQRIYRPASRVQVTHDSEQLAVLGPGEVFWPQPRAHVRDVDRSRR